MTSITQPFPPSGQSFPDARFGVVRSPAVHVVKHVPVGRAAATTVAATATTANHAVSSKANAFVLIAVIWVSVASGVSAALFFGI